MEDSPNKLILDRDKARVEAHDALDRPLELLEELVNYGTNLIPRSFMTSEKAISDVVVIPVLLKHAVTMLDSVHILLCQGALIGAYTPGRAFLEARIYISWMLQEDTTRRAVHYYVWHLRRQRSALDTLVDGTAANAESRRATQNIPLDWETMKRPTAKEVADEQARITRILAQPNHADADAAFARIEKDRKHAPWYLPLGVRHIRTVADKVGMLTEYDFFYTQYSKVAHASALDEHVTFQAGSLVIEPIRMLQGAPTFLGIMFTTTFGLYSAVLKHYRPGELPNFVSKYKSEWRARSRALPTIEYKARHVDMP